MATLCQIQFLIRRTKTRRNLYQNQVKLGQTTTYALLANTLGINGLKLIL